MLRPDLFPEHRRIRKKPRNLGHVIDAGDNGLPEGIVWSRLRCRHGHEFEVTGEYTIRQLKRGLPCPQCPQE